MVALTRITYDEVDMLPKRVRDRLFREALKKGAEHHKNVTMGKHFKDGPETQPGGPYGYEERDEKYTARKLARFGHRRPLVLTGRLMRYHRARSPIRGTKTRATLTIKSYFPLDAQRRAELEARTPQDDQQNGAVATEYFAREAAKPQNQLERIRRV